MTTKQAMFRARFGIVLTILLFVGFVVFAILTIALDRIELLIPTLLMLVLEIPILQMTNSALRLLPRKRIFSLKRLLALPYKRFLSGKFIKVSIRGRVAYAICCLENAMEKYGVQGESWDLLLENLWSFTTLPSEMVLMENNCMEFILERWFYLNSSFIPSHVIETEYFDMLDDITSDGYPELMPDKKRYNRARYEFIAQSNDVINEICDKIFDIGSCELWAGLDECSLLTLDALQKLIDYMKANDIPLPDVEPFRQHEYAPKDVNDDDYGWGYTFDGHIHSKYLKECTKQEEN